MIQWLAVSSGREGRAIQCLAVSNGRGVELSQWLAMSSRRERRAVVLTQNAGSSPTSTRRVRGGVVLTNSGRRCERGRPREMCAAARDVSGSWVSASTERERRELVHGLR